MSRAWEGGSTRAWRKVRAGVLARDGHRCQLRVPGICTTRATHAHHTVGREVSGDDPASIVAACAACNLHVGDPRKHDPAPSPRAWWDDAS
ncbi:HNH endonuclease [Pseudonocardia broussonetiae]|uniref:HNH endonuclease n=1 Tax=Pseudonocardia broussonetiae TaxID=2736640 RepID=A0A6M6JVZ2_9PSEU|nr:hypothetical protein [Pseudonocardia broussonetiae]QJY51227.1 hypothetical protein HOP40_35185 [Pseudonocardia broussonetiae]